MNWNSWNPYSEENFTKQPRQLKIYAIAQFILLYTTFTMPAASLTDTTDVNKFPSDYKITSDNVAEGITLSMVMLALLAPVALDVLYKRTTSSGEAGITNFHRSDRNNILLGLLNTPLGIAWGLVASMINDEAMKIVISIFPFIFMLAANIKLCQSSYKRALDRINNFTGPDNQVEPLLQGDPVNPTKENLLHLDLEASGSCCGCFWHVKTGKNTRRTDSGNLVPEVDPPAYSSSPNNS